MSDLGNRLFRKLNRQPIEEFLRTPTLSGFITQSEEELLSDYKLTLLGYAKEGPVFLSQEDREAHIHILGAPGEGKSKFIELLVRSDVESGYGACVLDPSENGDTALKILKYCASIGFEKVVYINPQDTQKIPVIQPIKHKAPAAISVGNMMDALKVLWQTKDFSETPRIQKYASALLHALHASGMTLVESIWFLSRNFPQQREKILDGLPFASLHRTHLTSAFQTLLTFEQFQSTVNRFSVFQDETLRLILGSQRTSVPFAELISKGWLILVNLDPQSVWGTEQIQQRLLGTLIINEVTYAIHRLNSSGWRGAYYLYIDEVGDYATSKLAYILDKKRKTGLRFTLAHQRFDQIDDRNVLSSVRASAKTKVLFYTPNQQDRLLMMKDMGYGGELPDRQVSYELGQTAKQSAAISIGKRNPRITRLVDIPDVEIAPAVLRTYIQKIYNQPWYHTPKEINTEINARFKGANIGSSSTRTDKRVSDRRTEDDRRTTSSFGPESKTRRKPVKTVLTKTEREN